MGINLQDWFGTHLAALWLTMVVLLLTCELLRRDKTMAMFAAGPLAATVTALIVPRLWWLQLIVAVVVAVACVTLVRPRLPDGRSTTA